MTDDGNIVSFPQHRIVRDVPPECVEHLLEKGKVRSLDRFSGEIAEALYNLIAEYGVDLDSEEFMRDFSFTCGVIRAMMARSMEIPHVLHKLIDAHHIVASAQEKDSLINSLPSDSEPPTAEIDTK